MVENDMKMITENKFKNFNLNKIIKIDKRCKTEQEKHVKNLCVKLTESEYNALKAIKMYYKKSYSDMIRDSILFLNNYYNIN
jgi:3-deoxy-D-manno-octulosonic acid (KDO) 8-phosphate synthase